ncbi:signal peptidase II [Pseudorhodobacter sp.]|uniref:signal peptidase II n=1 Tax=Pseudorhodobacter sp. TaxID=1934400 RepID=UPI0026498025|nr:signal peptidase II [Pseudorhodobacter sp.]MDN5785644.1 signal peptidase II [Pseudorhodobacter sp.]
MRIFWTALVVFALDQASKLAVIFGLNLPERGDMDIWPPYLSFRMAWNKGVNFGLFAHNSDVMRWILVAVSLVITAWVWRWMSRRGQPKLAQISAGILIGGALGNVVDRLAYGAVADFLNVSCCGIDNPYAFNVADIAIFGGAAGLVLFASDGKKKGEKKGAKDPVTRR